MKPEDDRPRQDDGTEATREVADEGGSEGVVELDREHTPATGSEAGETWRPGETVVKPVVRDETGEGRRSP